MAAKKKRASKKKSKKHKDSWQALKSTQPPTHVVAKRARWANWQLAKRGIDINEGKKKGEFAKYGD